MKSKLYFLFVFSFSIILFSCFDDKYFATDESLELVEKYSSVQEILDSLNIENQIFTVNPSVNQTILGQKGTVIKIKANAYTDANNGSIITTPVKVKLKEFLTLSDMIAGNAQTVSNQQLLISGGSFSLTFEKVNGAEVNVNPQQTTAKLPVQTEVSGIEDDLQYYLGEKQIINSREVLNWELAENYYGEMQNNVFNFAQVEKGFSNAAVLLDMENNTPTQFEVSIDGVSDYSKAIIWVIVENFPSVVMLHHLNENMTAYKTDENSIPVGMNATLLAITTDSEGYLQFGTQSIKVSGDDHFTLDVEYGTTKQLRALIDELGN